MTKKPPHVPETRDVKPNREQRRHPEGRPQDQPLGRDTETQQMDPQDAQTSKTGHGKKTADKWNQ